MTAMGRLCLLHLQFARAAAPDDLAGSLRRWQPLLAAAAAPGGLDALTVFHAYILEVTEMPPQRLADLMSELLAPELGDRVMSTADKLRAEGKVEGKVEGRVEGRAEMLMRQLQKRFGTTAEDCARRLRSATTADLDRWAVRLLDAQTLDEVFGTDG